LQIILSLNGPNNILPADTDLRDYLLSSKDSSIFEKILAPLISTFGDKTQLRIIMGEKDWGYRDWILRKAKDVFEDTDLFYAKNCDTQNQSIQAYVNNSNLDDHKSCIVIPKDTIIGIDFFKKIVANDKLMEVGLGTFRSNNPKYGYILQEKDRNIFSTDRVISDLAFSGVYFFKTVSLLKEIVSNDAQDRLLFDIFARLTEKVQTTLVEAPSHAVTTLDDLTEYMAQLNGI